MTSIGGSSLNCSCPCTTCWVVSKSSLLKARNMSYALWYIESCFGKTILSNRGFPLSKCVIALVVTCRQLMSYDAKWVNRSVKIAIDIRYLMQNKITLLGDLNDTFYFRKRKLACSRDVWNVNFALERLREQPRFKKLWIAREPFYFVRSQNVNRLVAHSFLVQIILCPAWTLFLVVNQMLFAFQLVFDPNWESRMKTETMKTLELIWNVEHC